MSSSPPLKGANSHPEEHDQERDKERDDEIVYAGNLKFGLVFAALCLSVFQVALDEVIVATAIPTITDEFHSLNDIGWYGSSYLFTNCSFKLLFGKLYSMFPIKLVYLSALAILELGSIVCAVAPNSIAFIMGRTIAGIGAGGIFAGVLTIMSHSVPRAKLAPWNGVLGAVAGLSFLSGPLIGGGIISSTTWRWIFYMNPIISIPTFAAVIFLIHLKSPKKATWKQNLVKLDLPSFFLFLASIICLLMALQWGGTKYSWKNARIIVLFLLFGLLMAAFAIMQIRQRDGGLVPLKTITRRSIYFGMMYSFCTSGAGFILEYYLPLWLQAVKGMSVIRSAVNLLPVIVSAIVCNLLSGLLVPIIGYYVPSMIIATVCMSVGVGIITTLKYNTAISKVLGYQVPAGLGIGVALQQTVLAAQTILPLDEIPIGVSLMSLSQTLGGTIGLSAGETIFTTSLTSSLSSASIPQLDPSAILNSGAKNLAQLVPPQYVDTVLFFYNKAVVNTWYLALAFACFSIVGVAGMEWKRVGPARGAKTDSGDTTNTDSSDAIPLEARERFAGDQGGETNFENATPPGAAEKSADSQEETERL